MKSNKFKNNNFVTPEDIELLKITPEDRELLKITDSKKGN